MKIAFVSQPFDKILPPRQNSVGIWIYEVGRRLAQRGDEVIVYAHGGLKPRKPLAHQGMTVCYVPATPNQYANRISHQLSRFSANTRPFFSSPLFGSDYYLQIALDLRRRQVDLVHVMNFSQFVPIVRAVLPNARIVLHMHCEWLSQLDQSMIASRLAKTDLVLGCSQYITGLVRERFPSCASRVHTIWNGVNEQDFYPTLSSSPARQPRLLFVSRLSPEKGVHILLRAFRQVVEQYPAASLELVGAHGAVPYEYLVGMTQDSTIAELRTFYENGTYADFLRQEIPAALNEQITFTGQLPHTVIPERFRSADLLINPALSEPFGMPLVEGMATGIPVVAARAGGMIEILADQQAGLLVNPGDPEDLAAAILRLLADNAQRQAMGSAGRQRVLDLFTWDRIVASLLSQYEGMLERHAARSTPQPELDEIQTIVKSETQPSP